MTLPETKQTAVQQPALVRRIRAHKSLGASIMARTLADRRILVRKAVLADKPAVARPGLSSAE